MFLRQVAFQNASNILAPEKYMFSVTVPVNMKDEARYRKKHEIKEITFSIIWLLPLNIHEYASM